MGDSLVEGKKTAVTYSYNNSEPFIVNTSGSMHSQSLKKSDTTLIDNQLKADALRMDGSLPEIMMNPYVDDEAKTENCHKFLEQIIPNGKERVNKVVQTLY